MSEHKDFLILVVDDEPDALLLMERIFDDGGYRVITACNGPAALELARSQRPDLVLLDIRMPGMDGMEVFRRLAVNPITKSIPVILLTAVTEAEFDLIDVFDYLPKPVDFRRLFGDVEYLEALKEQKEAAAGGQDENLTLSDGDYRDFSHLLNDRVGLTSPARRRKEFERALSRRMSALRLDRFQSYLDLLASPRGERELRKLVLLLTVGETYFFRNPVHFKALTQEVLPALKKEKLASGDTTIHAWSAGCSTGQEAYSLAVALREVFDPALGWKLKVTATDINNRFLNVARRALYRPAAFRDTLPETLDRWFAPADEGWRVRDSVRQLVNFRYLNLKELAESGPGAGLQGCDVVFCRNVLIYFDEGTARRIVRDLASLVASGGFVFLGHAESFLSDAATFETRFFRSGLYFRKREGRTEGPKASSDTAREALDRAIRTLDALPSGARSAASRDGTRSDGDGEVEAVDAEEELIRRGMRAYRHHDLATAETCYREVLHRTPRRLDAKVGLAMVEARFGRSREALLLCREVLEVDPTMAAAHFLIGQLAEDEGGLDEAIDRYRKSIFVDPAFLMGYFNLGLALSRADGAEEARRVFTQLQGLLEVLPEDECVPYSGDLDCGAMLEMLRRGKV